MEFQPLDRDGIAARIARDIPEGWFVNLGIGIPTKVSDFVQDREVIFVAENGDIANWARSDHEPTKQVGGAMDLAVGAQRLWVAMEHTNKRGGGSRIRTACSYPLTAKGGGKRGYTDLAVL